MPANAFRNVRRRRWLELLVVVSTITVGIALPNAAEAASPTAAATINWSPNALSRQRSSAPTRDISQSTSAEVSKDDDVRVRVNLDAQVVRDDRPVVTQVAEAYTHDCNRCTAVAIGGLAIILSPSVTEIESITQISINVASNCVACVGVAANHLLVMPVDGWPRVHPSLSHSLRRLRDEMERIDYRQGPDAVRSQLADAFSRFDKLVNDATFSRARGGEGRGR
jgi:hypothetical protein